MKEHDMVLLSEVVNLRIQRGSIFFFFQSRFYMKSISGKILKTELNNALARDYFHVGLQIRC